MKKSIVLVCFCILLVFNSAFSPVRVSAQTILEDSMQRCEQIEALYRIREELLLQTFSNIDSEQLQEVNNQIGLIDLQLRELGVRFLSSEDLRLFLTDEMISDAEERYGLRIDPIDSNINDWSSYDYLYEDGGVYYTIQKLIAVPKSGSTTSPLLIKESDNQTTAHYYSSYVAGSTNIISTRAYDRALNLIPYSTYSRTIYYAVHSVAPYITSSTEVKIPSVTYSVYGYLTAFFFYVRPQSSPEDGPKYSMASTHSTTTVKYSISSMQYKSGNTWVNVGIGTNNPIEGTIGLNVFPPEYASYAVAMHGYYYGDGITPDFRQVARIALFGPSGTAACTSWPTTPNNWAQLEY